MLGWFLGCSKLLSTEMKAKAKQKKINQQTFRRNSSKIKAIGNITPTMDHCPRNGYMGDKDPQSDMSC